jgi:acyl-CoA thioesterase FadM
MYPFVRMAYSVLLARRTPRLGLTEAHVSQHICWPWDLDMWMELNNGRTLTLFDLGRLALAERTGVSKMLRREGWGITVAGSSVRYRRRVRAFDRIEMHSRFIGWDRRFVYMTHSMRVRGECTSNALLRSAVTSAEGIVIPDRVLQALGVTMEAPQLPGWVQAWIAADAERPWPPAD